LPHTPPPPRKAFCEFQKSPVALSRPHRSSQEIVMPYIIGWFLGVPVIVLVILYLLFH